VVKYPCVSVVRSEWQRGAKSKKVKNYGIADGDEDLMTPP
jgi:hypothetical protein